MSDTMVEIGYRRKDSVEIVQSRWVSEDARYLYLECGKYVKNRIVSMRTWYSGATAGGDDDDEE